MRREGTSTPYRRTTVTDETEAVGEAIDAVVDRAERVEIDRPVMAHLEPDDDDPRAKRVAKLEEQAYEVTRQGLREAAEEVRSFAEELGEAPRPKAKTLEEGVRERVQEKTREVAERSDEIREKMERYRDKYASELPDYESSSTPHTEREVRDRLLAMDQEDRNEALQNIARNGTDAAKRAILNPQLPADLVGFMGEDHRERIRREIYRNEAPDALRSVEAIDDALDRFTDEIMAFKSAARELERGY